MNDGDLDLTPLSPRMSLGPRPAPSGSTAGADAAPRPVPARSAAPKGKPSATAMRVVLGGGGLAVLSAIASAIVAPPQPAVVAPAEVTQSEMEPVATGTPIPVQRPVQYIQLQAGQTAPPGATVIDPAAPTPMTIVTTVKAPAPARKPVVIKTTQSGKVIK